MAMSASCGLSSDHAETGLATRWVFVGMLVVGTAQLIPPRCLWKRVLWDANNECTER